VWRLVLAIPIIPTTKGGAGWFCNRRDTEKRFCAPLDVYENMNDSWYRFSRRLPKNAVIYRSEDGQVIGYRQE